MDESGSHVKVVFGKRRVQLVREMARQFQKARNVPYTPDMLGMGQHLAGLYKGVSKRT
jgi:hypothetical protein